MPSRHVCAQSPARALALPTPVEPLHSSVTTLVPQSSTKLSSCRK